MGQKRKHHLPPSIPQSLICFPRPGVLACLLACLPACMLAFNLGIPLHPPLTQPLHFLILPSSPTITTNKPTPTATTTALLAIPHTRDLGIPHLALQLEDAVHERLARRRAAGHVDVHRHNPVAPTHHAVAVVVVAAAVGAGAHRDDPARVGPGAGV
ncbi:hypothetical protein VTI74DRAFT_2810 [Chaetomium olivicolor]